ncbi:MAG: glycosyltransferase involved in cell wall biosynthesis [Parasphingorhabdus sp.]|jgi:glycosyltransferase involved in cell wall biosynthesis
MRIGIDLRLIHYTRTGFSRYGLGIVDSFLQSIGEETLILLIHPEYSLTGSRYQTFESFAISTPIFSPDEGKKLEREIADLDLDVLHLPFSLFPVVNSVPSIVTIHDLTCKHYPHTMENNYRNFYLKSLARIGEAKLILTVSEAIRQELLALGVARQKVQTCYPFTAMEQCGFGTGTDAESDSMNVADHPPFLLSVGSIEPRKNYSFSLDVFEALCWKNESSINWIIVANHGWQQESFLKRVENSPFASRISIEHNASDRRLSELYRLCSCFFHTSIYEGFGLPVLEAIAHACPVLSTPVPSLTEMGFPESRLIISRSPDRVAQQINQMLWLEPPHTIDHTKITHRYKALPKDRFRSVYRMAIND